MADPPNDPRLDFPSLQALCRPSPHAWAALLELIHLADADEIQGAPRTLVDKPPGDGIPGGGVPGKRVPGDGVPGRRPEAGEDPQQLLFLTAREAFRIAAPTGITVPEEPGTPASGKKPTSSAPPKIAPRMGATTSRDAVRRAAGPVLAWALEHSRSTPMAFARALCENARHLGFLEARRALPLADLIRELFDGPELERLDPAAARDLRALARGHQADELRMLGRQLEAEGLLREARRLAGRRGDPEIYARLLELEADLAITLGEIGKALRRLEEARPMLAKCAIPGRQAELLLRLGRANMARKRPDKALPALLEAPRDLPFDLDFRLRLEIFHTRAAAELALEHFAAAADAIRQVRHLYSPPVGDDRLLAQRHWLEGQLALQAGNLERAVTLLRHSLDLFLERHQTLDAFGAFADWTRALDRSDQLDSRAAEVRETFRRLLRLPGVAGLGRAELERWLDLAASRGLMSSTLRTLRSWLDSEQSSVH